MNIFIPTKNSFPYKFGKLPKKFDSRTLQLKKYLAIKNIPNIPSNIYWGSKVTEWPMYMNDTIGCCSIAGLAHMIECWTSFTSGEFSLDDSNILHYYEILSGYNPDNPETDSGCVLLDVLKYWHNVGIQNDKIQSFIEVNLNNLDEIKMAIFLFGGCYGGVQLPKSSMNQDVWELVPNNMGLLGGHCIPILGYNDDDKTFICITWGQVKKMSYDFFQQYGDELWAIITNDWINKNNLSPSGFDLQTLRNDLKLVSQ